MSPRGGWYHEEELKRQTAQLLLEAIERRTPLVLISLRDDVFLPCLGSEKEQHELLELLGAKWFYDRPPAADEDGLEHAAETETDQWRGNLWIPFVCASQDRPDLRHLVGDTIVWRDRFNLQADWVLNQALHTFLWWLERRMWVGTARHMIDGPEGVPPAQWGSYPGFSRWGAYDDADATFKFHFQCAAPLSEFGSRKHAKKHIISEFKKKANDIEPRVDEFLDRAESDAQGLVNVAKKRNLEHYDWAALHLCGENPDGTCGWSYQVILDELFQGQIKNVNAISQPVGLILKSLGLPSPRPRGRPFGSR